MNITLKIPDSPSHNMKCEYSYAENKIYKLGIIHYIILIFTNLKFNA